MPEGTSPVSGRRLWPLVAGLATALGALFAFFNGIPEFVDDTLPWFGERIDIGPVASTAWGVLGVVLLAFGSTLVVTAFFGIYRDRSRMREDRGAPGQLAKEQGSRATGAHKTVTTLHRAMGFGRDWIRCACGWTGSGVDFTRHHAGSAVRSTGIPAEPPREPDRARIIALATEAWKRLMDESDLTPASDHADARGRGLRLWLDQWEIDAEKALVGDEATLSVFRRPVDTAQLHYVEAPVHVLRTKLQRLHSYLDGTPLAVEMRLQDAVNRDEAARPGRPRTRWSVDELLSEPISPNDIVRALIALYDEGGRLANEIRGWSQSPASAVTVDERYEEWLERCKTTIERVQPAFVPRFRESLVPPRGATMVVERPNLLNPSVIERDVVAAPDRRVRVIDQIRPLLREAIESGRN